MRPYIWTVVATRPDTKKKLSFGRFSTAGAAIALADWLAKECPRLKNPRPTKLYFVDPDHNAIIQQRFTEGECK